MEEKKYLRYNLQYFAKEGPGGEKTEDPTGKHLDDARKDGQVCKSQELDYAVTLLAMFLVFKFWIGSIGTKLLENFNWIYTRIPDYIETENALTLQGFENLLNQVILRMLTIMLPILLIGCLVGFMIQRVQIKWKVTSKPLRPKFNKLNPASGIKKLFSKEKIFELVKSIAKILLIYLIVKAELQDKIGYLRLLYRVPLLEAISFMGTTTINLGIKISLYYLLIGFADWLYQKHKFKEDMKMTKQEVKDEMKNSEGDPAIKGKQRQKMREASMRRMMSSVPTADVVITNPTHFAVALKYDADSGRAPVLVAKGQDHLAERIKEIARENRVEIVENKPLARMIYHNVEIDEEIPPELYQAVAEILAYVFSLKNK